MSFRSPRGVHTAPGRPPIADRSPPKQRGCHIVSFGKGHRKQPRAAVQHVEAPPFDEVVAERGQADHHADADLREGPSIYNW